MRGRQTAGGGEFLIGMGETDLADGRCGLALLKLEGTFRQFQRMAPKGDRAGGYEHDFLAGFCKLGDVVHQRVQPCGLDTARGAVGQQGGADLDHDATRLRPFGAGRECRCIRCGRVDHFHLE